MNRKIKPWSMEKTFVMVDLILWIWCTFIDLGLFQVLGQLEFPFTIGSLTFNKVDVPEQVKVARREKRISVLKFSPPSIAVK
jgi:hypothetical protein